MPEPQHELQVPSEGPSLQALLGFVAVTHAQQGDEVLRQLLLQCLVLFEGETSSGVQGFSAVFKTFFGLELSGQRIQSALDSLVAEAQVILLPGSAKYSANPIFRSRVEARIKSAQSLQENVKEAWFLQCTSKFSAFDREQAWKCLQQYLTKLFRRHGIQTVQLLDARAKGGDDNTSLLKASLDEVLTDKCETEKQREDIEGSIHLFVSTVGTDPDRTNFIVQLADGAFSYYSLSAPPEVAARLRSKLKELTLFLDTNFLFGLLGLHVNPFDAVSEELISAIVNNKLPFKLRYHEATLLEMRRTIIGITSHLKGRHWPQALSRAAANATYVSSIERKFHEVNAKQTVDPEIFFEPYEHPDVLLADHGILIFRQPDVRLEERSDLINQYKEYLASRRREKPYEAIDHDMTVLDCVRHQRSKAMSSLDAKALMITCDTVLSKFDWQELRSDKEMACTVLPNQFLQLLRPFVPSSPEFDRSFAESFAIAEFRSISLSAEACSKLLSLLASYKDVKEETVSALLANDLLLENLKKSKDDKQFKLLVDAALVAENATLLEEVVSLKDQTEKERLSRSELEEERDSLLGSHLEANRKIDELSTTLSSERTESQKSVSKLQNDVEEAQRVAKEAQRRLESNAVTVSIVAAFVCSGVCVVASEYLIQQYDWHWLLTHPNSYGLRAMVYMAILSFFLGWFRPVWRKVFWWGSVGVVAFLVIIVSLLGGPSSTP